MAIDPICGMEVDEKTALSAEHEGQTYYFCSPGCREKFLSDRGLLAPSPNEITLSRRADDSGQQSAKATLKIKGMHC
ncbi:MAG TPA: YHS domain-containing protein, partial [Dehalococcoidia bacterium]|nr:YHS domain-containing protein [Dehalococcoidia bacterium]